MKIAVSIKNVVSFNKLAYTEGFKMTEISQYVYQYVYFKYFALYRHHYWYVIPYFFKIDGCL